MIKETTKIKILAKICILCLTLCIIIIFLKFFANLRQWSFDILNITENNAELDKIIINFDNKIKTFTPYER